MERNTTWLIAVLRAAAAAIGLLLAVLTGEQVAQPGAAPGAVLSGLANRLFDW